MRHRDRPLPGRLLPWLAARIRVLPPEAWVIALVYGFAIVNGLCVLAELSD